MALRARNIAGAFGKRAPEPSENQATSFLSQHSLRLKPKLKAIWPLMSKRL